MGQASKLALLDWSSLLKGVQNLGGRRMQSWAKAVRKDWGEKLRS